MKGRNNHRLRYLLFLQDSGWHECLSSLPKIAGMLDQNQGVHLQSLALPIAVLRSYCMTTGEPRAAVGFTSLFSRFPWWFLPQAHFHGGFYKLRWACRESEFSLSWFLKVRARDLQLFSWKQSYDLSQHCARSSASKVKPKADFHSSDTALDPSTTPSLNVDCCNLSLVHAFTGY